MMIMMIMAVMMVMKVMMMAMMTMVANVMIMMVVTRLFYRNEADAEGDGCDTCHMGEQLTPQSTSSPMVQPSSSQIICIPVPK